MKKVISLIIVLCMMFSSVPVMAEDVVLKTELFDRIEEIAENAGCTVFRNDVSIGVTKGEKSFVVMNDTVTYMENGMMVIESLYKDGIYVKMPEKAFESLLGKDFRKSDRYKEVLEGFQTKLSYGSYIQETIDTDYGTIVIWGSGGHMHATKNEISYVRYDGETIYISNYKVPQANTWMPCKYSAIEISEDGKKAIITYPKIEETVVFSPDAENRTLREKGQMVVTVDLVNCTAEYVNHPLEEEEATEEKVLEETSTSGSINGLYYGGNEKNPTLRWSYSDGTLTISGMGSTPAYGMSYGSGKAGSSVTIITRPKEWAAYFDEIEEIVLTDERKTIGYGFFGECVNVKRLVIGKDVTFNDTSFKESQTLESVTLSEGVTITEGAFQNCDKLKTISLYNNVILGQSAFFGCDNLDVEFKSSNVTIGHKALDGTAFYSNNDIVSFENELVWMNDSLKTGEVVLPEGITRIPPYMFQNSSVTSVVIPEGVNCIGKNAFMNCTTLKEVTFPKENEFVIEENAFTGTGLESLTITKNMRLTFGEISKRAFSLCNKLTSVRIEEGVEGLAPYMFSSCKNLSEVQLSESLKAIPEGAFAGSGIVSIVIPENVAEMGKSLFANCESLKNVYINSSITTLPATLFGGCIALEEVRLPDSITKIEHGAFSGCKIKAIRLPEGLKTIEKNAFSYADIEEIIIPEGCEVIGEQAFYYSKIKKLSIPGSVNALPKEMCSYCRNLTELSIGDGVKTIDTRTFEECDSLEKVTLPESIETLGYETFKWCDNLKEVNIPKNVTEIPDGFAALCKNLTKVTIESERLTHFGGNAFSECKNLSVINIPENLQWVGYGALNKTPLWEDKANWQGEFFIIGDVLFDIDSEKLGEKVVIPDNVRVLPRLGFSGNEKIVEVIIPMGVKVLPGGLFYNCENLKKVTLPESIEGIEDNVFYNCPKLEPIKIPVT